MTGEPDEVDVLLRPYPSDLMQACAVSKIVNIPKHDVPECIEPVAA